MSTTLSVPTTLTEERDLFRQQKIKEMELAGGFRLPAETEKEYVIELRITFDDSMGQFGHDSARTERFKSVSQAIVWAYLEIGIEVEKWYEDDSGDRYFQDDERDMRGCISCISVIPNLTVMPNLPSFE
jgi:hypothetical protein